MEEPRERVRALRGEICGQRRGSEAASARLRICNVEKVDQEANRARTLSADHRARWARPLAVAAAIVFLVSLAFPVVAGLSKNTASFPEWWGRLDVGMAFLLGALALAVMAVARGKVGQSAIDASYHAYRLLNHGIFALLIVFFLWRDRIIWANCLTGLAWRAWLLLYILPEWFTALRVNDGG